jgi:DNA-entry nuclease
VSFEKYSPLDVLGRPQTAVASVGRDLMPQGERGSIGMVKPVGFSTVRYDDLIADKYLYNRCHLIGWQLTGENANEKNLITGTRYMNVDGMLPFENRIASYVKSTGNHVLYRVTPVYSVDELVCRGLQMEAWSVEDKGEGLSFHVFVYNVQPGIEIDYATGESWRAPDDGMADSEAATDCTYVLNRSSSKFHYAACESVDDMSEKNKIYSSDDRDTIVSQGYDPCKRCNP